MTVYDFLSGLNHNLNHILCAITIISFIINIIQYKTKCTLSHFFSGICHLCYRAIRDNEINKKSNEELIAIMRSVLFQSISALRSTGKNQSYGGYDLANGNGFIYNCCKSAFNLAMAIKIKFPYLATKNKKDIDRWLHLKGLRDDCILDDDSK